MTARNELNVRAANVGLDQTAYANDSKLEQAILYQEKRATAFTGALAVQTLTSDATNNSDAETVTIGSTVYTWKTTLTEAYATGTLTSDATAPSDGETVTIEGQTYTFKTALSVPARWYEVLIGVSAAVALDNIKSAINADGTAVYGTGTPAHKLVTATTNTNTTQVVQANVLGIAGNSYLTAETSAHLSWGGSTLSGGANPVANQIKIGADAATSLDYLKDAINGTAVVAGAGTGYSTGTAPHPDVTATTNTNTTQVVQAKNYSITNASIATTETGAHTSWGAATLASGTKNVIAAGTSTTAGAPGLSGDANV